MIAGRILVLASMVALLLVPTGATQAAWLSTPREAPTPPTEMTRTPWQRTGETYRTQVTWTPAAGTSVTGYSVDIVRGDELILELEITRPVIILRKLLRGTAYTVRVAAVNDDGVSEPAELRMFTPGKVPPDTDPGELAGPPPRLTAISPATGRPGTRVTISGSNFDNLRYVKFGPRLAAFYVSGTTIVAIAPAGSGTVDIEVMSAGGASTLRKAYTYRP
ncbi:MAG: hypothetical protein FJW85_03315 [Actinobacteria bacterium]|nr:hypothetical protein [Actinomycetota bacterium]